MKQTNLLASTLLLTGAAHADITPHPLFCDHAVLQRDTEVPVWGLSNKEGEKVSVTLDHKPAIVTTAKDGKWMVKLPANPAGGPHTLTITGDKADVSFTHADKGLELKDVKDGDFQLAGAGQQFKPATTKIKGSKLVVTSPEVAAPTAVRYGWSNVPNAALWNKGGLPASPFRSDEEI